MTEILDITHCMNPKPSTPVWVKMVKWSFIHPASCPNVYPMFRHGRHVVWELDLPADWDHGIGALTFAGQFSIAQVEGVRNRPRYMQTVVSYWDGSQWIVCRPTAQPYRDSITFADGWSGQYGTDRWHELEEDIDVAAQHGSSRVRIEVWIEPEDPADTEWAFNTNELNCGVAFYFSKEAPPSAPTQNLNPIIEELNIVLAQLSDVRDKLREL